MNYWIETSHHMRSSTSTSVLDHIKDSITKAAKVGDVCQFVT